jgi:hypothetical protein
MFNLRDAFVRVMQAKAVRGVAQENLDYYDKEIAISRDRLKAGTPPAAWRLRRFCVLKPRSSYRPLLTRRTRRDHIDAIVFPAAQPKHLDEQTAYS